jgi:hypothetical protein
MARSRRLWLSVAALVACVGGLAGCGLSFGSASPKPTLFDKMDAQLLAPQYLFDRYGQPFDCFSAFMDAGEFGPYGYFTVACRPAGDMDPTSTFAVRVHDNGSRMFDGYLDVKMGPWFLQTAQSSVAEVFPESAAEVKFSTNDYDLSSLPGDVSEADFRAFALEHSRLDVMIVVPDDGKPREDLDARLDQLCVMASDWPIAYSKVSLASYRQSTYEMWAANIRSGYDMQLQLPTGYVIVTGCKR